MRWTIPATLKEHPQPPDGTGDPLDPRVVLDLRLPLQCITPVVGGGVVSRPSLSEQAEQALEPVRIPGIRGSLRRFWRAVVEYERKELFDQESRLFGGVRIGEQRGPDARRSQVVLSVSIDDGGKLVDAGHHQAQERGGFKAIPRWNRELGYADYEQGLGYALFALQRDQQERNDAPREPQLPTLPVRVGLRFTLGVRLRSGPDAERQIGELLTALCAFVHLGGLGARQSRGFGAVALQEGAQIEGLGSLAAQWQPRFAPPDRDRLPAWLRDLPLRIAQARAGRHPDWFSLKYARVLCGPADRSATEAHGRLLLALRQFRQGMGTGREARGNREGQSHWPEAQVLRALREQRQPGVRWEHRPDPALVQLVGRSPDLLRLPRAAFGLPIQVSFKDREDANANASLEYKCCRGSRFASPLWLRPLRCRQGYASLVILYPNRPESVHATLKAGKTLKLPLKETFKVRGRAPGTRPPIATWLDRADGDAADAFAAYLESQRFAPVGGAP